MSRGFAMIGFQQSAQTFNADDLTLVSFMLRLDDRVEALVNPLVMVVVEVFGQNVSQLCLGGEDQVIETLLSDRSHEALSVGIYLRYRLHPVGAMR